MVFFSALGWDGLRGAFLRASTISAPISCSTVRPSASRTCGNHSYSSSSMWWRTFSISTVVLAVNRSSVGFIVDSSMTRTSATWCSS